MQYGIFQFTPLREGRPIQQRAGRAGVRISIHAPPRGATRMLRMLQCFETFQFTPLREGRRPPKAQSIPSRNFNSRPSARGDARHTHLHSCIGYISIHAPPRGATSSEGAVYTIKEFQFTPLREGRRKAYSPPFLHRIYFNSRPSARGDADARRKVLDKKNFNSRPSARGDARYWRSRR